MKSYTITVNGVSYDVTVQETNGVNHSTQANRQYVEHQTMPSPNMTSENITNITNISATKPQSIIPSTKSQPMNQSSGDKKVEAPMPGKILVVKASLGQSFKRGEVLFVLEAMKLENEIVAAEDGVIASIHVSSGDVIDSGVILATFN